MKFLYTFILVLLYTSMFSQNFNIYIQDDSIEINKSYYFAVSTQLNGSDKEVQSTWKTFLKKQYKIKTSSKGDLITATESQIPVITDKRADIYFLTNNLGDNNFKISLCYNFGYDFTINPKTFPIEYIKMSKFFEYFSYYFYNQSMEFSNEEIHKQLNTLEKDKATLVNTNNYLSKNNDSYQKNINKNSKKIEKLNQQMGKEGTNQTDLKSQIDKLQQTNTDYTNKIELNKLQINQNTDKIAYYNSKMIPLKEKIVEQNNIQTKINQKIVELQNQLKK